jgi:competence protein ComEA
MKQRLLIVLAAIVAGNLLGSPPTLAAQSKRIAGAASSEATKTLPGAGLIDINSASIDELKSIPGISEANAKKIVENRPYKRKDKLVKKQVISPAIYDQVADEITARQEK